MFTTPKEQRQSNSVRGAITLSWKTAIAEAWKKRGKRHIIHAVIVSSILGIANMIHDGINVGLLRWVALAVVFIIINFGDDARLQRRASRYAWLTDPGVPVSESKY